MRSKKAQGELITMVLIILVIVAAVSIVAGIIFSLLNKSKQNIEGSSGCWGIDLEIVSAVPEIGVCYYGTESQTCINGFPNIKKGDSCPKDPPNGCSSSIAATWYKGDVGTCKYTPIGSNPCNQIDITNVPQSKDNDNKNCPQDGNCQITWTKTGTIGSDAVVNIKRNAGAPNTIGVIPVLLVNGTISSIAPSKNLAELDTAVFTSSFLALSKGDSIEIGVKLANGAICDSIKKTPVIVV
jgi:hypothetical protein